MSYRHVPGILAVTSQDAAEAPVDLRCALELHHLPPLQRIAGVWFTAWGLDAALPTAERPLLLPGVARLDGARVPLSAIARLVATDDLAGLGRMLPPFGVVGLSATGGLRIAVDSMGMRQVFHARGPRWQAASTSAGLLAHVMGVGLDEEAVLVQSQLGWQLGGRTMWSGVTALSGRQTLLLDPGGLHLQEIPADPVRPGTISLHDAVEQAVDILTGALGRYLDDTPAPVLQLTGGQDSRLVLSSIPATRREGLRAITLAVPGSEDAAVAGRIAQEQGLRHHVRDLTGVEQLSPEEWFRRVVAVAEAHDSMLSPVAKAVTGWAEESLEQGDRLGGLGGEVARGFYYAGRVAPSPVTRARSDRLAQWRMLANESVPPESLHPRHRRLARATALDAIHAILAAADDDWFTATDELYFAHRMPRWAGLAETVASTERHLVNPLLEPRFIRVARGLSPAAKNHGRFLARLQVHLDPALAALPLDGRPAPRELADPGLRAEARHLGRQGLLLARKAGQRLRGASRPPAGGEIVAARVVEHLRRHPQAAEPLLDSGWIDPVWLRRVLAGEAGAGASSVAFMVNLLTALETRR